MFHSVFGQSEETNFAQMQTNSLLFTSFYYFS